MSLLIELILACSKRFDAETYPPEIYFYLLDQVRDAKSADALGSALTHLLAWKDGKVRKDVRGPHKTLRSKISYRVGKTKPNTLSSHHEKVLKSQKFFEWAVKVRKAQTFDASLLSDLATEFGLWKNTAVVIPAFFIHCLCPPIYPIVDRYVIIVYNIFQSHLPSLQANPSRIDATAYSNYHTWWLRLMTEAGIQPLAAKLKQLKEIDSGIWQLGKSIASKAKEVLESGTTNEPSDGEYHAASPTIRRTPRGTKSPEFKARAIELWEKGATQAAAIQTAATEMNIDLKDSYLAYPGSHFDRWRKQGYWRREN